MVEEVEGFHKELLEEVRTALNRAMPQDVINHIQGQVPGGADMLFPNMFPGDVGQQILQNLEQVQQHQPPPVPDYTMDHYTMSYRDPDVENAFLRWELDIPFGVRSQNFFAGFMTCLAGILAYYPVFQCDSGKGAFNHWPCEGRFMWIYWSLLMWILPFWNVIPLPYIWQYRDLVCALHQLSFGCFMAYLSTRIEPRAAEDSLQLDPMWFCTLPVLLESTVVRVRLKYYVFVSLLLMAVVLCPWLTVLGRSVKVSPEEWIIHGVIMFVAPGCLLMAYEKYIREQFEKRF